MKVTVCFGSVRVVVPCGKGELLVGDLIEKAVCRYRKAIGKPADYWVTVHNLKSFSDGGILDPDDQLIDVADDREQIIALYEEQGGPPLPHNGGDGTSASSVGTSSPDIFQGGNDLNNDHHRGYGIHLRDGNKNDVVITRSDLNSGSTLIVRRGSEPALTNIGKSVPVGQELDFKPFKATKRWSAIASIDEAKSPRNSVNSDDDYRHNNSYDDNDSEKLPPPLTRTGGNGEEANYEGRGSFNRFARDSARQSLANNAVMYKWLEAQERQQDNYETKAHSRREPLGGSGTADDDENQRKTNGSGPNDTSSPKGSLPSVGRTPEQQRALGTLIVMKNTGGALGIHVVPDFDDNGRDMGLLLQGIEAGGRIYRDGRLKVNDRIIEINGTSLVDVDFTKAQEIFKEALHGDNLELRVIKSEAPPLPKMPPPPTFKSAVPKTDVKTHPLAQSSPARAVPSRDNSVSGQPTPTKPEVNGQTNLTSTPDSTQSPSSATSEGQQPKPAGSPTKKTPPAVPARNPNTVLTSSQPKSRIVAPTNTRRIGKKITMQLKKGAQGLGFSITTRDNPAGGPTPIYIKNIMPKGAAIDDGRLKPGDRLLEVNTTEVTGQLQSNVVNMLRNVKPGQSVSLVVSRQVIEEDKSAVVPRELSSPVQQTDVLQPADKAGDDENITASKNKELIKLNIALNETGSAGLGVSVKGKTTASAKGMQDLGIFIKSIITGGAASKDGRLRVNDQLVEVNHQSLAEKTNTQAMELLRDAMHKDGPTPGFIHLVVARRIPTPSTSTSLLPEPPHELRVSRSEPPPGVDYIAGALGFEKLGQGLDLDETDSLEDERVPTKPRNPALDRAAAASSTNIRNMSYQRATHESMMNATEDDSVFLSSRETHLPGTRPGLSSPTISGRPGETVMIENDDDYQVNRRPSQGAKARPASTLGFLRPEPPRTSGSMSGARSNEDLTEEDGKEDSGAPKPPDWLVKWDKNQGKAQGDEMSPTEEAPVGTFEREGFGRQSMSEKRKGHVDPRLLEFYQKMKLTKDKGLDDRYYSATWDPRRFRSLSALSGKGQNSNATGALKRAGSAESLLSQSNNHQSSAMHDHYFTEGATTTTQGYLYCPQCSVVQMNGLPTYPTPPSYYQSSGRSRNSEYGPSLGLKKSSSLESLQTAVQEVSLDEEVSYFKPPNRGMVRGRGCNESFRAAVDRSYDEQGQPLPPGELHEESSENGSFSQGQQSQSSSFSTNDPPAYLAVVGTDDLRDGKKPPVRKKSKKEKPDKDKGGLFKGLGHMFRFGKHRKPEDKPLPPEPPQQKPQKSGSLRAQDFEQQPCREREDEVDQARARQMAQMRNEQERIHEQYRQLQEAKRQYEQRQIEDQQAQLEDQRARQGQEGSRTMSPPPLVPMSRADRIQQLRSEHQRRHRERQGQYPLEDQEEQQERQLQELERQRLLASRASDHRLPPRRPGPEDPYDRPPSRMGHLDPSRYSHYQNYQEIQEQLNRHDYYQQQYQRYMAHQQMMARQGQRYPSDTALHDPRRQQQVHDAYARGYAIPDPRQDPRHDPRHDPRLDPRPDSRQDPRLDARQDARYDPRHYPHSYSHTGLPQSGPTHRSQTPINQVGYVSHHNKRPPQGALAAHYAAVPPPNVDLYSQHMRHYSEQTEHPRSIYSSDPNYGSLPRRPPRDPSGHLQNAAKV